MEVTLTCRKCATEIVASDEDELVQRVQDHVVRAHSGPGGHTPSREHVLNRLRRHGRRQSSRDGSDADGQDHGAS